MGCSVPFERYAMAQLSDRESRRLLHQDPLSRASHRANLLNLKTGGVLDVNQMVVRNRRFLIQPNRFEHPRVDVERWSASKARSRPARRAQPQIRRLDVAPTNARSVTSTQLIAGGGTRTHTPSYGYWILNPARLPIPPLRPIIRCNKLRRFGPTVNRAD
jgi:hypothetical protein